jgi:hypothetical protein
VAVETREGRQRCSGAVDRKDGAKQAAGRAVAIVVDHVEIRGGAGSAVS